MDGLRQKGFRGMRGILAGSGSFPAAKVPAVGRDVLKRKQPAAYERQPFIQAYLIIGVRESKVVQLPCQNGAAWPETLGCTAGKLSQRSHGRTKPTRERGNCRFRPRLRFGYVSNTQYDDSEFRSCKTNRTPNRRRFRLMWRRA